MSAYPGTGGWTMSSNRIPIWIRKTFNEPSLGSPRKSSVTAWVFTSPQSFPRRPGCDFPLPRTIMTGIGLPCGGPALLCDGGSRLLRDDQVGASLLRPITGWLSGTGTVAGFLEAEGEPVPYAHVYAVRRTPGGMRDPVGAFANARGEFLIEGLPPGDYVLWAHPIRYHWNQRPLIQDDAETDVKDTVLTHPVRVEAGRDY